MHTVISSRNHGCNLNRATTGKVDGSVHGVTDGVLNLSIYNDNEVYGSELLNDLSCDIKNISAPQLFILIILHVFQPFHL